MTKNLFIGIIGLISGPIIENVEKYLFNDWDFVKFLISLVIIDTAAGVWKHWKYKTLSADAWGKVISKIISYGFILVLAHILTHFTVDGEIVIGFSWLDEAIYSALVVKEGISIFQNVGAINPNLLPKWLLTRMIQFDENGKFLDTPIDKTQS